MNFNQIMRLRKIRKEKKRSKTYLEFDYFSELEKLQRMAFEGAKTLPLRENFYFGSVLGDAGTELRRKNVKRSWLIRPATWKR